MDLSFAPLDLPADGTLILGVFDDKALTPLGQALDKATNASLTRALEASPGFAGKTGQKLVLPVLAEASLGPVVLIGLGARDAADVKTLETFGAAAQTALAALHGKTGAVAAETALAENLSAADVAAHVALGAKLRSYGFDKYHTTEKSDDKNKPAALSVLCDAPAEAEKTYQPLAGLAEGIFFTRDLVSEPANVIYPESFVEACRPLESLGLRLEVLDESAMRDLGMGALLGVAQGSVRAPRLLVMSWGGGKSGDAPTAIVGKGVCFDSGGISIKPSAGMEDMKWDMAGAAVVAGLMKTLAMRKAPLNVVGLCGLVENMPSGSAQRPGDVVTSMSGQTIEVINTDAEGRLVLADVLHYANTRFKPSRIVDLATLTGAILISLGSEHAGLFSNDDALSEELTAAGKRSGERLWRFPLSDAYDKMINSDIADMKNAGAREAGSITAAQFLKRFVDKTPWAHLDIAGVTWSKKDRDNGPKGATGFGVRLLDDWLKQIAG